MLKELNLKQKLDKESYNAIIKPLQSELSVLQQRIMQAKIPVIVIFEGLGAAGKGETLSSLIVNLDPRGFDVYSTSPPEPREARKPWLARFAKHIPRYGNLAFFDRGWYSGIVFDDGYQNDLDAYNARLQDINVFERQLADDGYLILKFFLHISKDEQKKRMKKLLDDPATRWRVSKQDMQNNEHYAKVTTAFDLMVTATDKPYAKWTLVPSTDRRYVRATVFQTLATALKDALAKKEKQQVVEYATPPMQRDWNLLPTAKIEDFDLHQTIDDAHYDAELDRLQGELRELHNKLYLKKKPLIICYEGNDAAGKGGNIKRVARALDPRGYSVTPISAPSTEELNHQYLWRFWNALPVTGHIGIFDRTWYGRVLVERVEGFTPMPRIMQAYNEINEFEYMLTKWGATVLKFWIAVTKDEQLKRFEDRQNNPDKQWKITEEDWRNREKWDVYNAAINDMFAYTNTPFAPWRVIESVDKHYARIKTLSIIVDAIRQSLHD